MKSFAARFGEDVEWMKTGKLITPAVRDASSTERDDGVERLSGPRQDGWRGGIWMLCHLLGGAV